MKKIFALAAMAALTAGVSAYAANPFSDVTPDDWAYQAVSDLSDQGVVEGYPDGTFKGERNMTRYELAQIIARLMAKEDQLNAEQRATLDKLAGEYADELANLGVRVSNLEKKVGNISWSGDARMRYINNSYADKNGKHEGWDGRMRINVHGQVNDSTYVQGRLVNNMKFKGNDTSNTTMDRLYVNHSFGDFGVRLGRQDVIFGNGLIYDDFYDGAQLSYDKDALNITTGYGRLKSGNFADRTYNDYDFFFAKAGWNGSFAKIGAGYINFAGDDFKKDYHFDNMWGLNTVIPIQDFRVEGEYWKSNADNGDTSWNAGIGYGKINYKKPGTWKLDATYNKVGDNAYLGLYTNQARDFMNRSFKQNESVEKVKFWNVTGEVALQQNVYLHGEYDFDVKADDKDLDDAWTLSLNYKF